MRRTALVVVSVLTAVTVLAGAPWSGAYEINTAAPTGTVGGSTQTITLPSGLTETLTLTGNTTVQGNTSTIGTNGGTPALYTPGIAASTPAFRFTTTPAASCTPGTTCTGQGTITVTYSQPVTNPVLHFAGIGAVNSNGTGARRYHDILTLAGSSPAGASLGGLSAGATNLKLTGSTLDLVNDNASTECDTLSATQPLATAFAGCGSVRVVGTVTSVTFNVAVATRLVGSPSPGMAGGETITLATSVDQDYGDAPTSYDAGNAAASVLGDLHLGATDDADNTAVANSTTDPNAVTSPNSNNGANGDGTDEDAFTTLPPIRTSSIGSAYALTVPISGATKAGQVCGWIDFDRSGTFNTGNEQVCGSFAAGATSVNLSWTVPATSAGLTYARFRAAYGTVAGPTGLDDSGEVEDYQLAIMPTVRVNKVLAPGSSGTFDLSLNGTIMANGVGNGGTTGPTSVFNTSAYGAPDLTVAQDPATSAVPITFAEVNHAGNSNSYATTYSCVNGNGTTVSSGSTTSVVVNVPASTGTNGAAQNIVCTFTNTQSPAIALVKSISGTTDVNGNGTLDAGDAINYTFLVTNTGGTALTSVGVTDPKVASVTCPSATLALGASETCTGSHTITQAEVDAGSVPNTATASGTGAGIVVTAPSSATQPIPHSPALSLQKTVGSIVDTNGNGSRDAGDQINWTFLVTNTGNVTVSTVAVSDPKAGAISCPATTLAPGASTTCTAGAYAITQAEVDAGVVTNTATATGKDPGNATVTSNNSSTSTPIASAPAITVTKSASVTDGNGDGVNDLGDTIHWTFLVKNTGNVTLSPVVVNDVKAGPVTCPVTTLAPGATTTCTATTAYTITQADVNAGSVHNTATATGTPPTGGPVTSPPSSTDTPVAQTAALQLTKSAAVTDVNGDGINDLGDTIQWSFLVKNTGTTTVSAVAISDPTAGPATCLATTLAPGATTTCTATTPHTITQADVDAGFVANTATATGQDPSGAPVSSNPSSTDTPVVQVGTLALVKSAAVTDVNGDGLTDLGDTISWSFLVTNTGTVTLHAVAVADPKAGPVTCPVTTLAPGATTTCTASPHAITQAEVDAGVVNNTATASAVRPDGVPVASNPSSTSTPVDQAPALSLTKSAAVTDVNGNGITDLGDTIQWSFLVKNTGTTTVTNLVVNDPTAGAVTCPVTTLAVGASTTCTATSAHTITQADVDAGHVDNTATATGKDPSNNPVTAPPSSTSTPVDQSPALSLTKSAAVTDVNGNGIHDLGDTITWSFLVKNTGTTTVTNLVINDPTAGAVTCPVTTLAVGASTTCTSTTPHTITQTDVNAGFVANTATATGKDPHGTDVPSPPSSTDTPVAQTPVLTLTKSASVQDLNGNGVTDLGDAIQWSFLVKNTGTVTVTNLAVNDPKAGATTCPVTSLAPGASTTCTATTAYPIAQVDVDAGDVANTATATGTGPTGAPVTSNPSSTNTPVDQSPALSLTKSAAVTDVDGGGTTNIGDTIQWSFLVENTGTVTVTDLVINDPTAGAVTCPVTTLAVGASTTCTSTTPHPVTQADVDAGVVANTATATGHDPHGTDVPSPPSSTDTPVVQTPGLTAAKHATVNDVNGNGITDLGDTITYTVTVTNTGTVTLHAVTITDPKAGAFTCPLTTLAPGASTTCTATVAYTITQADVEAGHVDNTAVAHATDPPGGPVDSPPDTVVTPVEASSGLQLVKHAARADTNGDGHRGVGDKITWTFTLTNTGTRTISTLAVSDPTAGAVTCPAVSLAPGASATCTADVPHTVTQADVDAGFVANTATASGVDSTGTPVPSNPSSTVTSLEQKVGLRLVKKGVPIDTNKNGRTDVGDHIQWSFVVTNIGLVTLTGVTVTDPKAGPVTCAQTTLAPGASTTCTADNLYLITAADVKVGSVHNVATVVGDCGCGRDVPPVKGTANVPTTEVTTPATVVPGLPFTGATGVVWGVRGGAAMLLIGAALLLAGRRRREAEDRPHRAL